MHSRRTFTRCGFTLVDLCAVLVVSLSVVAIAAPTLNMVKKERFATTSAANLMQIGQGSAMYVATNDDRLATYSWSGGNQYTLPNGNTYNTSSDQDAASLQNQEILMRLTGRTSGGFRILSFNAQLAHRRFVHLPLLDFMGPMVRAHVWADPADANLINWQRHPLQYFNGSSVPYANGFPDPGYEQGASWSQNSVRQRWAFTTSYETAPAAWAPRGPGTYGPVSETPHLYRSASNLSSPMSEGRSLPEVAFPGLKVHMYEEFDRRAFTPLFFAYDFARPHKLMFDGSLDTRLSGNARPSSNPLHYPSNEVWRQRYVPLDTFPVPVGGLGDDTELNMRFRWTYDGLHGFDYAQ